MNADEFLNASAMIEASDKFRAERERERLEHTLEIPTALASPGPVSREEFIEFIRCIAEGDPLFTSKLVSGQRAIELAAWEFYRRLQEAHEL
jgi:hypothetical protein